MITAAKSSEFSQNPFLAISSPKRKRLIMMKDLTAGILLPEIPRYMIINGKLSRAAA